MTAIRTGEVYVEALVPQAYGQPPPVSIRTGAVYVEVLVPEAYDPPPPVRIRTGAIYIEALVPPAIVGGWGVGQIRMGANGWRT